MFATLTAVVLFQAVTLAKTEEKSPLSYTGREYRDPTLNPLLPRSVQETKVVPEAVKLPPLTIQGIVWGDPSPKAIINEKVVVKGDFLPEGVEILDISKTGIKVLYRGKIFTLLPEGGTRE